MQHFRWYLAISALLVLPLSAGAAFPMPSPVSRSVTITATVPPSPLLLAAIAKNSDITTRVDTTTNPPQTIVDVHLNGLYGHPATNTPVHLVSETKPLVPPHLTNAAGQATFILVPSITPPDGLEVLVGGQRSLVLPLHDVEKTFAPATPPRNYSASVVFALSVALALSSWIIWRYVFKTRLPIQLKEQPQNTPHDSYIGRIKTNRWQMEDIGNADAMPAINDIAKTTSNDKPGSLTRRLLLPT